MEFQARKNLKRFKQEIQKQKNNSNPLDYELTFPQPATPPNDFDYQQKLERQYYLNKILQLRQSIFDLNSRLQDFHVYRCNAHAQAAEDSPLNQKAPAQNQTTKVTQSSSSNNRNKSSSSNNNNNNTKNLISTFRRQNLSQSQHLGTYLMQRSDIEALRRQHNETLNSVKQMRTAVDQLAKERAVLSELFKAAEVQVRRDQISCMSVLLEIQKLQEAKDLIEGEFDGLIRKTERIQATKQQLLYYNQEQEKQENNSQFKRLSTMPLLRKSVSMKRIEEGKNAANNHNTSRANRQDVPKLKSSVSQASIEGFMPGSPNQKQLISLCQKHNLVIQSTIDLQNYIRKYQDKQTDNEETIRKLRDQIQKYYLSQTTSAESQSDELSFLGAQGHIDNIGNLKGSNEQKQRLRQLSHKNNLMETQISILKNKLFKIANFLNIEPFKGAMTEEGLRLYILKVQKAAKQYLKQRDANMTQSRNSYKYVELQQHGLQKMLKDVQRAKSVQNKMLTYQELLSLI